MPDFDAWWWEENAKDYGPPRFKVGDWVYWLESPLYSVGPDAWSEIWRFRVDGVQWDEQGCHWVYICGQENIHGKWYTLPFHENLYLESDPLLEHVRRSMLYTDGLGNTFPGIPPDTPLAYFAEVN